MDHEHDSRQLERLTFFSDAVFAIAMTLLVIEVRLPHLSIWTDATLAQALADLVPNFIGFVISFVVIGRFWLAHHRVFGLLARTSERLLAINLALLLTVAFMPFPTAVISEHGELSVAVLFYGSWLVVMGLVQHSMVSVALAGPGRSRSGLARPTLVREDVPEAECRYLRRGSWIPLTIGLITLVAAVVTPRLGMAVLVFGSPIVFRLFHR